MKVELDFEFRGTPYTVLSTAGKRWRRCRQLHKLAREYFTRKISAAGRP
jgi:hypothetical protein